MFTFMHMLMFNHSRWPHNPTTRKVLLLLESISLARGLSSAPLRADHTRSIRRIRPGRTERTNERTRVQRKYIVFSSVAAHETLV
jgi:hypothetical protein